MSAGTACCPTCGSNVRVGYCGRKATSNDKGSSTYDEWTCAKDGSFRTKVS